MEEIANALHVSHGSVSTTLHDRLGMHKLTARWVPKSLSDEQMATRASVYSAPLKRFRSNEDDFLSRLVTVDETWVHYYEPENKAQSRQSVGPGSPRPKKFKTQPSPGTSIMRVDSRELPLSAIPLCQLLPCHFGPPRPTLSINLYVKGCLDCTIGAFHMSISSESSLLQNEVQPHK